MKNLLIFLLVPIISYAQNYQNNDPYAGSPVIVEVNIQIDRYYPSFGNSEKPYSNEKIIHLTEAYNKINIYLHFEKNYSPPKYDAKLKTMHLYYTEEYYDYIFLRLSKDTGFVIYREYKDGHKWGEIYFDKYP